MADKKKALTPEQIRLLRQNGLDPAVWEVLQDYQQSMLVRRTDRSKAKVIQKKQFPS